MRRTATIVAICALLALSGCLGFLPGGGGGGGGGGSGLPPAEEVASAHNDSLESAGTFTFVADQSLTIASVDRTQSEQTTTKVNLDEGTYYAKRTPKIGDSSEIYRAANGTVYRHTGGRTMRATVGPGRGLEYYVGGKNLRPLASNMSFSNEGTTTVDGVEVTHYAADDTEGIKALMNTDESNATVSEASAHIYRTDDGLVKRISFSATIEGEMGTAEIETTITYKKLGSTAVPHPEWVGETQRSLAGAVGAVSPAGVLADG